MDTFDLNWPKTQATFYTDGWRCRIVWRQQGGPGGTIDNHNLCKRRLADSLGGAPYLLAALRARGYGTLAEEIESLVETPTQAAPAREAVADRTRDWIAGLDGDATFAETGARRSKVWFELGQLGEVVLFLKEPPARGKSEWVLKRTWPDSDRKAEYVAGPYLRGLFSYLQEHAPGFGESDVETLLKFCGGIDHPEIVNAIRLWKDSGRSVTH